jgi:hypothetical protein
MALVYDDDLPNVYTEEGTEWWNLSGFDGYTIHKSGNIHDTQKGRQVAQQWANNGFQVNLRSSRGARGYTTARVASLVAQIFVPRPDFQADTVIFLDGDRRNHHASNLMWRSRSYAIRYHRQITDPEGQYHLSAPYVDEYGIVYSSCLDAAIANGLLPTEVRRSAMNNEPVLLTSQQFWMAPE